MSDKIFGLAIPTRDRGEGKGAEGFDIKYTLTQQPDSRFQVRIVEIHYIVENEEENTGSTAVDLHLLIPAIHMSDMFESMRQVIFGLISEQSQAR